MSKRDRLLLLEDMLESIRKIFRYTKGMSYNNFAEDDKTIDAVVRNLWNSNITPGQSTLNFQQFFPKVIIKSCMIPF